MKFVRLLAIGLSVGWHTGCGGFLKCLPILLGLGLVSVGLGFRSKLGRSR
jgi:hypothetical protein